MDEWPPQKGEKRWSGYFGQMIELEEYRSNDEWYFRLNGRLVRNQTQWSKMPKEPPISYNKRGGR